MLDNPMILEQEICSDPFFFDRLLGGVTDEDDSDAYGDINVNK